MATHCIAQLSFKFDKRVVAKLDVEHASSDGGAVLLKAIDRELGVTATTLAQWREAFLMGGQAALKSRPTGERDDEIQRLRAKVGEITMNNELLLERCHRLEANLPLPRRRPSE